MHRKSPITPPSLLLLKDLVKLKNKTLNLNNHQVLEVLKIAKIHMFLHNKVFLKVLKNLQINNKYIIKSLLLQFLPLLKHRIITNQANQIQIIQMDRTKQNINLQIIKSKIISLIFLRFSNNLQWNHNKFLKVDSRLIK